MAEEGVSIEIGPRGNPMIASLREDLRGSKFLYADKDSNWMDRLAEKLKWKGDGQIVQGNANQLMISSGSISTLFAKDVLGHQGIPDISKKGNILGTVAQVGNFNNLATEWHRVISEKGKVIILETGTPPDEEKIIDIFTAAGFKLVENYKKNNLDKIFATDNPEDEMLGKSVAQTAAQEAYALVFEKGKINHL